MPDSLLLPITLDRLVDANGDILANGTVEVYDAGTLDEKSVFSDSSLATPASNPLEADAGGWLDARYIGTGAYKIIIKDEDGATVKTVDNLPGALDTSGFTPTFAKPDTPVINKAADFVVLESDLGKVINVDPTGGAVVGTLISAVTAGDGARLCIRHIGTANTVTLVAISGQTINGQTSRALGAQFESLYFVSDGANWHIDGHAIGFNYGQVPFIYVESRTLTIPPTTPTAGARYIIAASGTPSGLWTGMSNGDVMESNGQGGWIRLQPQEGWHAYDKNANQDALFTTAWEGLPSTDDPEESNLGTMVLQNTATSGTGGGTPGSGWTKRTLNTERVNTITGASVATSQITLPTGRYRFLGHQTFLQTNSTRIRVISTTDSAKKITSANTILSSANADRGQLTLFGELAVTEATEIFEFQYICSNTPANGLGEAQSLEEEIYATLMIEDIASLQGPQGDQGSIGPEGFAGFKYTYSSTTSMADPGAGIVRLNNATLASVTAIAIDDTSAATGNPDVSAEILSWDDSSSTNKGKIKISKVGAAQNYAIYQLTALTDNSGWTQLAVTHVASAGTISNTDSVAIEFIEKGDKGDAGTTGPTGSTSFNFDNATADADPGTGELRLNNATAASATEAYIDNNNRGGSSVTTWLDSIDDNGASGNRGTLHIMDAVSPSTVFHVYKVTGSVVDGTGYRKVTISSLGGAGSFTNGNELIVAFFPAGATGTIGGSTGGTDNAVQVADGAGGSTLKASSMTVGTDGKANVNLASALTNTVGTAGKFSHTTSDTPAAGIGIGVDFEVETSAGNNEIGARVEVVTTDVTGASEDFDWVVKLMAGGSAVAEKLRVLSTGIAYLGGIAAAIILKANGGQTLTGGFKATPFAAGTKSSGTYTPLYSDGNFQTATNGGAHTLAPPADDCTIIVQYTNNGSAGAITTSGFSKVTGSFTTTDGADFFAFITKVGSFSHLNIVALQ